MKILNTKQRVLAGVFAAALMAAAVPAFATDAPVMPPAAAPEHKAGKPPHAEIDTDKDGKVSKAEFLKAQEDRFAKMDTDSDGYVTQEEFKTSRDAMKKNWEAKREKAKELKKEKAEAEKVQ